MVFTVHERQEENLRKLPEKELRVLLIERGGHPFLGQWALPGGFVRLEETVGQAAFRELKEETGVEEGYLEQLYTFSTPERDPRMRVISCAHMALVDSEKITIQAGDDARNAAWFRVESQSHQTDTMQLNLLHHEIGFTTTVTQGRGYEEPQILENNGLAFDHAKIIVYALQRLRGKLFYSDLALRLLPEFFTLTQLQQVYEVILGKTLLTAAFRRKMAPFVQETGQYTEKAGHRPSQLYRKRKNGRNYDTTI